MILDKPVAVSDEPNTGREYETIVILELKKPMRNDYTQAENPIIQMLGYVDKIIDDAGKWNRILFENQVFNVKVVYRNIGSLLN